jgi:hypothetical protein
MSVSGAKALKVKAPHLVSASLPGGTPWVALPHCLMKRSK